MSTPFYDHPFLKSDAVAHGFFGRGGGVSTGIYAGLNCGAGSYDSKAAIAENRRRVAVAMGAKPEALCTLYQIHSPHVVIVQEPLTAPVLQADAMVTDVPGLLLGILTADCAPILFTDHEAGVVGAAHAGWKGAFTGVIENTVETMEKLGARRESIRAVIGPCIAQASYEVGPEFIARFDGRTQQQFFIPSRRAGHGMFDLPAYASARLRAAGLQRVAVLSMDTCSDAEHFFSYRRATLHEEPDYGRHISVIGLKK